MDENKSYLTNGRSYENLGIIFLWCYTVTLYVLRILLRATAFPQKFGSDAISNHGNITTLKCYEMVS